MAGTIAIPEVSPKFARGTQRGTILIVEDETDLADMLRFNLTREGFDCTVAGAGDDALASIARLRPDLVLLDRMLPGMSGDDVLAAMGRDPAMRGIPVLMLTAKAEEADQLVGFALGAADYVPKPFSMKLLLARIAAILRRAGASAAQAEADGEQLSCGPITVCFSRHEALLDGQPAALTVTEFRILAALVRAGGRVLSRAQLLDIAFGSGVVVTDRTVDVHITAVRRKLGKHSAWVRTVRGVGYSFRQPGHA